MKNKIRIGFLFVLILGFIVFNIFIDKYKLNSIEFVEDNYDKYVYELEKCYFSGNNICLEGFFFEKGGNSNIKVQEGNPIRIGLINEEDVMFMELMTVDRKDVDEYFNGGSNLIKSGFRANIEKSEILANAEYEIIIKPVSNLSTTIHTEFYLCNGDIYKYSKDIHDVVVSSDKKIQDIYLNGTLMAHSDDNKVFVFEKDNEYYWLIKNDYRFNEGRNNIFYRGKPFDDNQGVNMYEFGSDFESDEITSEYTDPNYRICKRKVNLDKNVYFCWTGHLEENGEYRWLCYFRPQYPMK